MKKFIKAELNKFQGKSADAVEEYLDEFFEKLFWRSGQLKIWEETEQPLPPGFQHSLHRPKNKSFGFKPEFKA